MFSPTTVVLVAASALLASLAGLPWWAAVIIAVVVWALKIAGSRRLAARTRARANDIDPFAIREPWRLLVKRSLRAQRGFAKAIDRVAEGPLRERLGEIGIRIDHGVQECWEVARRAQNLTDARRSIDIRSARKVKLNKGSHPEQVESAEFEIAAHQRLDGRETEITTRLEILNARLDEAVTRVAEMAAHGLVTDEADTVSDAIDGVVGELESLRLGLDAVDDIQ